MVDGLRSWLATKAAMVTVVFPTRNFGEFSPASKNMFHS